MGDKQEVSVKTDRVELVKVIAYLEALTAGLKAGSIFLKHGSESMALYPKAPINFEVSASKKRNKEKCVLEISWHTESPAELVKTELTITNKVPVNFADSPGNSASTTKGENADAKKAGKSAIAKKAKKTAVKK